MHSSAHVHFPEEQAAQHDLEIVVKEDQADEYSVHLGFLQYRHRYHVNFSVKDGIGGELTCDPLQNLHVHVVNISPMPSGHQIELRFFAHKERLLQENIALVDSAHRRLKLKLFARVLGKGKGTPALKNGIHCYGVEPDDESEVSDWKGF